MKKAIVMIERMSGFSGWVSGILICIALGLISAEIVLRTFFSQTLYIADEYAGYLMSMVTFCGMAYTLRERGHIRMMMLPHHVKGRHRVVLDRVCYAVGFIFSLALTGYCFSFFWDSAVHGSRSMHVSETYLALPQFFMPLGALLLALQFLSELLKTVAVARHDAEGLRIMEESDDLGR